MPRKIVSNTQKVAIRLAAAFKVPVKDIARNMKLSTPTIYRTLGRTKR